MTAEEHLAEVQRLATARLKAAKAAAAHEGLVLVDGARLALLERLLDAAVVAIEASEFIQRDPEASCRYFRIERDDFVGVIRCAMDLRKIKGPAGCLS